jgi:hypothetical protein
MINLLVKCQPFDQIILVRSKMFNAVETHPIIIYQNVAFFFCKENRTRLSFSLVDCEEKLYPK